MGVMQVISSKEIVMGLILLAITIEASSTVMRNGTNPKAANIPIITIKEYKGRP